MSLQSFRSSSVCSLLTGACIGAVAMYFFDPQTGRRRRALVQDQVTHATHVLRDAQQAKAKDVVNRVSGLWNSLIAPLRRHDESDVAVNARVRSILGRLVPDANTVESSVQGGRVVLTGTIRTSDVQRVLAELRGIAGVREIDNRLREESVSGNLSNRQTSSL